MGNSKFADPDVVRALTGSSDRVVCLRFTNCKGRCLYAHYSFLAAWSGVLRNVLEDTQQEVTATDSSSTTAASGDQTIPLDDADTAAWEDCLDLMYPSRPLFSINWENAPRLLMLSRKYDMPAVTAHVVNFMNCSTNCGATSTSSGSSAITSTRFEAHLSPNNADFWLELAIACEMEQQAELCIKYIAEHLERYTLNMDLLFRLQPKYSNSLLKLLQERFKLSVLPLTCSHCKNRNWSKKLDGTAVVNCVHCGRALSRFS